MENNLVEQYNVKRDYRRKELTELNTNNIEILLDLIVSNQIVFIIDIKQMYKGCYELVLEFINISR